VPDETVLLVTSDQVVVHEGKILEKPESADEARSFIKGYGSSPCSTVGCTAVTNLRSGKRCQVVDIASIFFDPIPDSVIEDMLSDEDPMVFKCAGGLMVEDPRIQPYLVKIEGGMDSVMGMGKRVTRGLLNDALTA